MSTNSRLVRRNRRKASEVKRELELQTDFYYLEALKIELKQLKNHHKLQRIIHRKKGWRDYTV